MFGISGEHLLILGIILLVFGPRRLPQVGHTVGKTIRNFREALNGIKEPKFRRLSDTDEKEQASPDDPKDPSSGKS